MPLKQVEMWLDAGAYLKARKAAEGLLTEGGLSRRDEGRLHFLACRAALGLKEPFAAARSGELAARIAEQTGANDLLASVHFHLGSAFTEIGDASQAEAHLTGYLSLRPAGAEVGVALWQLGRVYRQRKEWARAALALERAAPLIAPPQVAALAVDLAWCFLMLGDALEATRALQAAQAALLTHPDDTLMADVLSHRAFALRLAGDLSGSPALCQEVFMPGRKGAGDVQLALVAWVMGLNALDFGQPTEAAYFADLTLNHAVKSGRPYLMNLAGDLRRRRAGQTGP